MKARIRKAGLFLIAALAVGYIYIAIVEYIGFGIPCVFYEITGLRCPGCGVTQMCISLINFDIGGAFKSNGMLLILLPILGYVFGKYALTYIKTGRPLLSQKQNVLIYICIGLLLLFAIFRNIYHFTIA